MSLFSPKWRSKNPTKRIKWVKSFNHSNPKNLEILQSLMKNDTDETVKSAIENRILELLMVDDRQFNYLIIKKFDFDEQLLRKIIKNINKRHVKVQALLKLGDQKLIADELLKAKGNINDYEPLVNSFTDANEQRRAITKHKSSTVRIEMIDCLQNLELLAEIAQNDPSNFVRIEAIYVMAKPAYDDSKDLSFENKVLKQIALNDKDKSVAEEAALKITDISQIIELVKESTNGTIIKSAIASKFKKKDVEYTPDKLFLAKFIIYNNDFDTDFLVKLFNKIDNLELKEQILYEKHTDENFMNKVFKTFSVPVEEVKSEKMLFILAKQSQDDEYTTKIIEKIHNEDILLKLINLKGGNKKALKYLISRIENKYQILSHVFKDNNEYDIQRLVIDEIQDKESFVKLLINKGKNDEFNNLENEILEKIGDSKSFLFIAENAKRSSIKKLALIKINDQDIIANLFKNTPYPVWIKQFGTDLFFTLLNKVENEDILFEVVVSLSDWKSRLIVLNEIKSDEVFKRIKEKFMETDEFKEASRKNQPKDRTWKSLIKDLKEKTDISNPRTGAIKWNYGNSQTEIVASYGLWDFKSTLNPMSNCAHLDITHKLFNYSKSISAAENKELSDFLYKIF